MSGFQKILAKVGIGAATVDTKLHQQTVKPGERLTGEVVVMGGNSAQDVDEIYLSLVTQYYREHDDREYAQHHTLAQQRISERFTINPNEERRFPCAIDIPIYTPLTYHKSPVFIKTGLNIAAAFDPTDVDQLLVTPTPLMQRIFDTAKILGMSMREVECEYNSKLNRYAPFVQEIEFEPGPRYSSKAKEIEFMLLPDPDGLDLVIEIDRRIRGLRSLFERKEVYTRVRFTVLDFTQTADYWTHTLDQTIRNAIG